VGKNGGVRQKGERGKDEGGILFEDFSSPHIGNPHRAWRALRAVLWFEERGSIMGGRKTGNNIHCREGNCAWEGSFSQSEKRGGYGRRKRGEEKKIVFTFLRA